MRKVFLGLLAALLVAGCGTKKAKVDPAVEVMQQRLDYIPAANSSRVEVEAYLGRPDHVSRTKEGYEYCLYELEGEDPALVRIPDTGRDLSEGFGLWRSVIYDRDGQALDWYGFHRDEPTTPPVFHKKPPEHQGQPKGALTGASVFVNPGHGWFWTDDRWTTQRGLSHGIIEDHSNGEAVLQYLVKYLWNAGARVYTARERDFQSNMVIVEPGDAGWSAAGSWDEEKARGTWNGSQMKVESVTGEPTATARYTPHIPEEGYYAVYAWYRPATSSETTTDARMAINHTGGSTLWVQNQNHDGYTWKYLGTYYFDEGANPESGSVVIDNKSAEEGRWVIADAIRFGGGMGDTLRDGEPSGHPRWEESGRYYTEFMGFPHEYDSRVYGTVGAMPMWAAWEMEPWEKNKSIYVSWHTNASGNGKSRGLFSFIYGPNAWDPLTSFTGFPGGIELCKIVHDRIMTGVHADFDPEWRDGAKVTRWLGETNPRNNNKMPASLYEYGFHDNEEDAAYILDPIFRDTVAKATYQGIVKFYAWEMPGFENATLLPEKPTHLSVLSADGGAKLAWQAPPSGGDNQGDAATGYRVYRSANGKGFDNGVYTEKPELMVNGLEEGEVAYFRVAAVNDGGESWPSETLAVSSIDGPRVLLVNGFDRMDRGLNLDENGNERGILSKMNTYDYSIQHAEALAQCGVAVDGASNEAVIAGDVLLGNYDAVAWILGQENDGSTFDADERELVAAYLDNGGAMFISGSEVAADLAETAPDFLEGVLKTEFVSNDSGIHEVSGGPDRNLSIDSTGDHVYPVQTPDVIRRTDGEDGPLVYADGGGPASVLYEDSYRLILMGFPFEAIQEESARNEMMAEAMSILLQREMVALAD